MFMCTLYKQKDYDSSPIISNDPVFLALYYSRCLKSLLIFIVAMVSDLSDLEWTIRSGCEAQLFICRYNPATKTLNVSFSNRVISATILTLINLPGSNHFKILTAKPYFATPSKNLNISLALLLIIDSEIFSSESKVSATKGCCSTETRETKLTPKKKFGWELPTKPLPNKNSDRRSSVSVSES